MLIVQYRQHSWGSHGIQIDIPPNDDCLSGQGCLFSYPGLQCHGFLRFVGSCGDSCIEFEEVYLDPTDCLNQDTGFTLNETSNGVYTFRWKQFGSYTDNPDTVCDDVVGPPLVCTTTILPPTDPTPCNVTSVPSGTFAAENCW